jgi:serine phosphatase RsbU (regulator of sigma subunit)
VGNGNVITPARWGLPLLITVLAALVAISRYDYALFHMIVEGISVIVAASLFLVVFHTRRLQDNDYLLFVGIGLLFFVLLDVPHALGFHGVALFPGFSDDLPTQAYIAQRLLLSLTFVLAPIFLRRRLNTTATITAYAMVVGLVFLSLFVWRNFPSMFVTGEGLTPLKRVLEYVIIALFSGGAVSLGFNARYFDRTVLQLLVMSLLFFIGSEVAFSLYSTPVGLPNLIGHLAQVAAFYFAYRAVLVTALVNPFGLLFRQLSAREQSLTEVNESLNALAGIGDTAISTLDLTQLAPALLHKLVELMHADAAALLLAEDGKVRTVSTVGFHDETFVVPIGTGFSGMIAQTREPRYVADILTDDSIQSIPLREQGIVSVLGVPMEVRGRLIGVLHVDWRTHHAYQERDLRLLEIVADRIALAIRNAQLYAGERRIAQIFQESLLTLPDAVEGIEYARSYHSATEEAWVGGDFFDLFSVESGRIGILIGDVSGKGVDAAVLTSLVKDTIRAHAHEGRPPAEVLNLTNDIVERYSGPEIFVTAFFGVLDRRAGRLTYCNGGHPPVIATSCDGTVRQLSANSPLIGAFPDMEYVDTVVPVSPRDTLVLYTDGVIEARREGRLYGEGRLLEILAEQRECEPQAVIDAVLADLMSFTGGSLSDDLAILALRLVEE